MYTVGVQLGLYLAMANNNDDDSFTSSFLINSLDSWSIVWETYMEPIFETVYNDFDDYEESDNPHKGDHRPKFEPELVQFQAPAHLKLPKPVINVGFPKAGTSSIFSFFHCNGLVGQHWFCCENQTNPAGTEHQYLMSRCILENVIARHTNKNTSRQIFDGCGEYDFYSEINGPRVFQEFQFRTLQDDGRLSTRGQTNQAPRMIVPQHHYLDLIHEAYPNATFVLNTRPVHAWVQSVMQWSTTLKQELVNEFWFQDVTRNFTTFAGTKFTLPQSINVTLTNNTPRRSRPRHGVREDPHILNQTLQYIMEYHSQYIRNFCQDHPSHALIEVDITDNKTGQILADAFGLQESCWGHKNENNKPRGAPKGHRHKMTPAMKAELRQRRKMKAKQRRRKIRGDGGGMFGQMFARGGETMDDAALPSEEDMDDDHAAHAVDFQRKRVKRMERLKGQYQGRLKEKRWGGRAA